MNKKSLVLGVVGVSLLFAGQVFAHTTVKPASVGVAKFQTFTVSAPSEKPITTIGIRLVLPEGLNHVSPNVKQGWKVEVKKGMVGGEEKVTEIIWTGGAIPTEMRDEFNFSAQAPSKPTTLNWKAYQTYADGTVVSWDQDPSLPKEDADHEDSENTGPYSKTEVIDDLTAATAPSNNPKEPKDMSAIWISLAAVVVALAALKRAGKK